MDNTSALRRSTAAIYHRRSSSSVYRTILSTLQSACRSVPLVLHGAPVCVQQTDRPGNVCSSRSRLCVAVRCGLLSTVWRKYYARSPASFHRLLLPTPNQQCQSTEGSEYGMEKLGGFCEKEAQMFKTYRVKQMCWCLADRKQRV